MRKKMTTEDFIKRARAVHGDKYDYSKVVYVDPRDKVEIVCKTHGPFWQGASKHLCGAGCNKCGHLKRGMDSRCTQEEFLMSMKTIHSNTIDFSKVVYRGAKTKVELMCNRCGNVFYTTPSILKLGCGCPNCANRDTPEEFITKAKNLNGSRYDYSSVVYTHSKEKVRILCNVCHTYFLQEPRIHLSGAGCPECVGKTHLDTLTFIKRASSIHGDYYDYSKSVCENSDSVVIIGCKEHGYFEQRASVHLQGCGCNKCSPTSPLTNDEFISRAKVIHKEKYNYDSVVYKTAKIKVAIYCNKHLQLFEQTPDAHLAGKGCPICSLEAIGDAHRHTTETYIAKAVETYGILYDYSNTIYITMSDPINIFCKKHMSSFSLTARQHLLGMGCPQCKEETFVPSNRCTTDMFIEKAVQVHGDKYGYENVHYGKNAHENVSIFCKRHELYFMQSPHTHLSGSGCPVCHYSYSAIQITKLLESYKVSYEREYRFEECRDKKPMPFDFAVFWDKEKTHLRCLIEYDGEQHYREKPDWGGIDALQTVQLHDKMKDMYCLMNHISLIRIPYWEKKHIKDILIKELQLA